MLLLQNEANLHPPARKCAKRTQFCPGPRPELTKRTQSQPGPQGQQPKNAKRTQFPPTKMRNEPNSSIPSALPPLVSAKRTQSQPRRTRGRRKIRNEPNPRCGHFTKRTQFAPTAAPIVRNKPNFRRNPQYTFYNIQYAIPWPNLPSHRHNPFEHPLGAGWEMVLVFFLILAIMRAVSCPESAHYTADFTVNPRNRAIILTFRMMKGQKVWRQSKSVLRR